MRKGSILFDLLIVMVLTSCVTSGWNDTTQYSFQQPKHEIIGKVTATKRYIQPFFIGPSSLQKRNQLTNLLKEQAKKQYGDTAEIDNIKFESSWHPASLLFYFSLMGYVEDAGASADVYDPIAEKISLQKKQDEIQQQKETVNNKARMVGSDIVVINISTSEPNSAAGVNLYIDYRNIGTEKIKYITFGVVPYNRVDDPVSCNITRKSLQYCKITGPIDIGIDLNACFENVWYNSTISYAKIQSIEITYMDNTKKTIDNIDQIANSIVQ